MKTFLIAVTTGILLCFALSTAAAQQAAPATIPDAARQKLGVFVYPAQGQTPEQQKKDESECYAWAHEQSGVDPTAAPTAPKEIEKASNPADGARVAGAAKGAAGGAAIGAIKGDAGTGAAVGATAGVMKGGAQKRQGKKAAKQMDKKAEAEAKQQAAAADAQKLAAFKKAYMACVTGRGYTAQ